MDAFHSLMAGFGVALQPAHLMWAFVGSLLGTAIGVLPGIGPALTIALLLPVTVKVAPNAAFIMFAGVLYGAMYGGSTTSILLNTPRSEEHMSELQSLMRISNAVFCLKKQKEPVNQYQLQGASTRLICHSTHITCTT